MLQQLDRPHLDNGYKDGALDSALDLFDVDVSVFEVYFLRLQESQEGANHLKYERVRIVRLLCILGLLLNDLLRPFIKVSTQLSVEDSAVTEDLFLCEVLQVKILGLILLCLVWHLVNVVLLVLIKDCLIREGQSLGEVKPKVRHLIIIVVALAYPDVLNYIITINLFLSDVFQFL